MIDIEKLDKMQAEKNSGRGISCVRQIVAFLRSDDERSAKATAQWDHDKIRSYPDIHSYLVEHGFITLIEWKESIRDPV